MDRSERVLASEVATLLALKSSDASQVGVDLVSRRAKLHSVRGISSNYVLVDRKDAWFGDMHVHEHTWKVSEAN
jgi:hypothetical protein